MNLKGLCEAQRARLAAGQEPAVRYHEPGYVIDDRNRFAYFVARGSRLEERKNPFNGKPGAPVPSDPHAIGVQANFRLHTGTIIKVDLERVPTEYGGTRRFTTEACVRTSQGQLTLAVPQVVEHRDSAPET